MTDRRARLIVATLVSLIVSLAVSGAVALRSECAPPWRCQLILWPPHLSLEYRP
jgi:hypothetical protein